MRVVIGGANKKTSRKRSFLRLDTGTLLCSRLSPSALGYWSSLTTAPASFTKIQKTELKEFREWIDRHNSVVIRLKIGSLN